MPRQMRQRYIAVKIDCEKALDERDFYDAFWTSMTRLFGEYGASQAGLSLIEYDAETNRAILRCSHKALDQVRAAIIAITEIKNEKTIVQIPLVSGTLKSLRNKLPKNAQKNHTIAK